MERVEHGDGTVQIRFESKQELMNDLPNRKAGETFAINGEVFEVAADSNGKLGVHKSGEYQFRTIVD